MKKISLTLMITLAVCHYVTSQNVGINSTGATPAASAMLDISATDKGLLIPRVALTATNVAGPITAPATSLLVYNTATAGTVPNNVIPGYYYWNGTSWATFASGVSNWSLTGNTGTTAATNFIGTTDAIDLVIRTNNTEKARMTSAGRFGIANASPSEALDITGNVRFSGALMPNNSAGTAGFLLTSNGAGAAPTWAAAPSVIGSYWAFDGSNVLALRSLGTTTNFSLPIITNNVERMRIDNLGRVGIGTSTFDATNPEKFIVNTGTTTSVNAIVGKGSINNYLQLNIQNQSNGANASSDVVATANNGSETTNFVDMGINSSTNSSNIMGGANDAYLYNLGENLLIGTGSAAKSLVFMTGGTTQSANERMRIDGNGNVGIGTTTIPKGAIGASRLAIDGVNGSMNGPHLQFTTAADNYPLMGFLPWTHDNSYVLFDTYWDGTTWRSSTNVGGNFRWQKASGILQLGYANINTPGAAIPAFSPGWILSATGNVAIGTSTFAATPEKLLVDAGATTSFNAIVGKGSIDSYLQLNIQNQSSGTNVSSDVVATANNGSETTNYIDMGINGGSYSGGVMGAANDSYMYNIGQNMLIGTGTAAKSLIFMTGGTTQGTNERMRIDGNGRVGIAKTAPTEALDVVGNMRFSGALMPNNLPGTAGEVLISGGAGAPPTWLTPGSVLSTISWAIGGNNVSSQQNIGTTSNFALPFITNNTEKMRISATGDVAIGTSTFNGTNPEQLLVDVGSTMSVNGIVAKGTVPTYLQLNVQNLSNGNGASSDIVATADNGSETNNFIDMGINSSTNNAGVMGGLNDSYIYNVGQNMLIGTGSATKSLILMTGGTTQATNERLRITGTGNVGIGNNNPNSTLSVAGSLTMSVRTNTGVTTISATDHVVINTGGAANWALPAANISTGRIYRLINHGTGNITLSLNVTTSNGATTTTITNNPALGEVNFEIISDGTIWRKIN